MLGPGQPPARLCSSLRSVPGRAPRPSPRTSATRAPALPCRPAGRRSGAGRRAGPAPWERTWPRAAARRRRQPRWRRPAAARGEAEAEAPPHPSRCRDALRPTAGTPGRAARRGRGAAATCRAQNVGALRRSPGGGDGYGRSTVNMTRRSRREGRDTERRAACRGARGRGWSRRAFCGVEPRGVFAASCCFMAGAIWGLGGLGGPRGRRDGFALVPVLLRHDEGHCTMKSDCV